VSHLCRDEGALYKVGAHNPKKLLRKMGPLTYNCFRRHCFHHHVHFKGLFSNKPGLVGFLLVLILQLSALYPRGTYYHLRHWWRQVLFWLRFVGLFVTRITPTVTGGYMWNLGVGTSWTREELFKFGNVRDIVCGVSSTRNVGSYFWGQHKCGSKDSRCM